MGWKVNGQGTDVLEVWESFNGDLYFISEKQTNGEIFCYTRLYSIPEGQEWGWNNIDYLKKEYGKNKLWEVLKKNWGNINSYQSGILEMVK